MLIRLTIHDVVLIEKLVLNLSQGLNVFTGETGAGKSILLDALGLALGERSDAGLVRQGALQASVMAEFSLPSQHAVFSLAETQGLAIEEPLILRRVVSKDGKSRAFINDQPVSIALLKQFGGSLLEIHGQFETHGLLNQATHRGLLDTFAGLASQQQEAASAFAAWKEAEEKRATADAARARAEAEEEFLRAAVSELDQLAPEVGESDKLAERRTALQHREKIIESLHMAEQLLNSERGAVNALAQAGKAVARVADKATGLQDLLATIDRATEETAEAAAHIDRLMAETDAEPDALEKIEERLFALRSVARKHHVQPDALPDLQRDLATRLSLLTDQGDVVVMLQKQAATARNDYKKRAEELSAARRNAAAKLETAIAKELPPLKLERAAIKVGITPLPEDQWSATGIDRIVFQASTNPGAPPGPLQKVASGGELARFMLALKVVLAASDPVPTFVFDEVDSGIGGATASAVGERLAELARHTQILVVTHSPQVAALAQAHIRVSKRIKGEQAFTSIEPLSEATRREEIARMLAGNEVTEAARLAAESLIEKAVEHPVVRRQR